MEFVHIPVRYATVLILTMKLVVHFLLKEKGSGHGIIASSLILQCTLPDIIPVRIKLPGYDKELCINSTISMKIARNFFVQVVEDVYQNAR